MKRNTLWVAVTALAGLLALSGTSTAQVKAEVALRAAMEKETVQGDLKGAIAAYKKLAKGSDRAVAAKALIRLGEAYEKQGSSDARKQYDLVITKFPDQREAVAQARAHLGGSVVKSSATMLERVISLGTGKGLVAIRPRSNISADGRYIILSQGVGGLIIRDISNGSDRPLVASSDFELWSSFSRDGKWVAFGDGVPRPAPALTYPAINQRARSLFIASTAGNGSPQARLVQEFPGVASIVPYDWTRDGRWLFVVITRKNSTREIGMIAATTGEYKRLTSVNPGGTYSLFLSPDDKYLAFDRRTSSQTSQRDIVVLTVDSAAEQVAAADPADDQIMGWSPDGRYLLFRRTRSPEAPGLWAVGFANGKVLRPQLIRPGIGEVDSFGITNRGALYFERISTAVQYIRSQTFDFRTDSLIPSSVPEIAGAAPIWSTDGDKVAYFVGSSVIKIRDLRSEAKELELTPTLRDFTIMDWSKDESLFLVRGVDSTGKRGLFGVDARNASVTALIVGVECGGPVPGCGMSVAVWAPDSKSFYFSRFLPKEAEALSGPDIKGIAVYSREVATGKETELLQVPVPGAKLIDSFGMTLSPDGRYLIKQARGVAFLIPTTGGPVKELATGTVLTWSPDSQSVIVVRGDTAEREMQRVYLDGTPRKLAATSPKDTLTSRGFSITPSGRVTTVERTQPGTYSRTFSVLENFLP